jgi:hypothetical protein
MKALISIMIITIGVLVFLVVGTDTTVIDTSVTQDQSEDTISLEDTASDGLSADKATKSGDSSKLYAKNTSDKNNVSGNENNLRYEDTDASYNQDNSSYGNNSVPYSKSSSNDGNNSPSYSQGNSNTSNSQINADRTDNTDKQANTTETAKTEATDATEKPVKEKYQRLYDNGIMWYGNTGTLAVEYESSHAETTGIGFRVHYDSSSIRPTNITQFPVDAIVTTSPEGAMVDSSDRDMNPSTDAFLTFAWASIYGQWPQTNQLTLASIDFEKINGGSTNYTVSYSVISVPAGFQLIN